ncbi:MAG: hypothetical protein R3D29_12615 [Nitratireductor sp.]
MATGLVTDNGAVSGFGASALRSAITVCDGAGANSSSISLIACSSRPIWRAMASSPGGGLMERSCRSIAARALAYTALRVSAVFEGKPETVFFSIE